MKNPAAPVDAAVTSASPWEPLRHAVFGPLWIATVVSNIGSWMHDVGAGWLMTSLSPSPLMVALVQSATTFPAFLLALPAGALADIVDRRRYLVVTQIWMMTAASLLGALTLTGFTNAWILLAFTFAMGIGTALMMPAWASLTPEIVPRAQLQAAVSLNAMGMNVARAIGPAVAGLIVAASGPGALFLLNAVSFLGVMGVILWWRRQANPSTLPAERFFSALRAGVRYARNAPDLQAVLVRGGAFFLFASAPLALLPLIARHELSGGPNTYGILLASIGVGAVSGALLLPRLRAQLPRDLLMAAGTVVYALAALALAFIRDLPVLILAMLANGAAWITVMSSLQVAAQTALPTWVRARGSAVLMVVFMGGMAIGSALGGQVATLYGIPTALIATATGSVLGLALTWRFRIGCHDDFDLTPSMHWPTPVVAKEPHLDRGPVMVMIEYRIAAANRTDFVQAMQAIRRIRRRNGAVWWGLFNDAADPERYTEHFVDESWVEHLRHHERVSAADRACEERARAFHLGAEPPRVFHLLAESAPKPADGEGNARYRRC